MENYTCVVLGEWFVVDETGAMADPHADRPLLDPEAPDLEYDLAHEADPGAGAGPEPPLGGAIEVPTQTVDYDGDLSYDLAHDIPRT